MRILSSLLVALDERRIDDRVVDKELFMNSEQLMTTKNAVGNSREKVGKAGQVIG